MIRKVFVLVVASLLMASFTGLPQDGFEGLNLYLPFAGIAKISQGHGGESHDVCSNTKYGGPGCLWENRFAVDIVVPTGTPVLAPTDGTILGSRMNSGLPGLELWLGVTGHDGTEYVVVLLHLDSISVMTGQRVRRGDIIARSGWSGLSRKSAEHIHMHVALKEGSGSYNARTSPIQIRMAPANSKMGIATAAPRWYSSNDGELNSSQIAGRYWRSTNRTPSPHFKMINQVSQILQNSFTGEYFAFANNTCYHLTYIPERAKHDPHSYLTTGSLNRCAYGGDFPSNDGRSDGMLLRGKNGNLFLIENGSKRLLPSHPWEILYTMGYWKQDVIDVKDIDAGGALDGYPTGRPILPFVLTSYSAKTNCPSAPKLEFPKNNQYLKPGGLINFTWEQGNSRNSVIEITAYLENGLVFVHKLGHTSFRDQYRSDNQKLPDGKYSWRVVDRALTGYCKTQAVSSIVRTFTVGEKPWWVWPWFSENQSLDIKPEPFSHSTRSYPYKYEFSIRGLSKGSIRIFNLSGGKVFSEDIISPATLNWSTSGLANGVYLYVITGFNLEGREINSGIKKIMVFN